MKLKHVVALALMVSSTAVLASKGEPHGNWENAQASLDEHEDDHDSGSGGGTVTNTNTNTNTSSNTNRNNNNNTNSNTNTSTSSARGGNASTGSNTSTTSVVVQGDNYPDIPVSSAYAPNVQVGGADMCRSGVSGGSQTSAFGISLGGTVVDTNCERLKLSREIAVTLGDKETAKQLLCQDPRVAKAYAHSGSPCHVDATVVDTKVTTSTSATPFGNR